MRWGALVIFTLLAGCQSVQPAKTGPVSLFDGVTLDGWQQVGEAKWFAVDSMVVGGGGDGYFVTEQSFDEYKLSLEFNVDAATNSGVFVQCQDVTNISPLTCFEINIWDHHPRQEYRTGAIVTLKPPIEKLDTLGQWNLYEISVSQNQIEVVLNGVLVSRLDSPDKTSGFIALQRAVDGDARFRNITLQPVR